MKILVTTVDSSKEGGVANFYSVLKPYFSNEVIWCTVGSRKYKESAAGILKRLISDFKNFRRSLNESAPDLVHLNPSLGYKALFRDGINIFYAKRHGCKVLVFFRGWDLKTERVIRTYFLSLFRWIYFKADAIIVLAEEFKLKLLKMGFKGAIYVESTVVSEEPFEEENKRNSLRKERGTQENFHVLFLSRMDAGKGIDETLEAFRIFNANYPKVTLIMAGDGPGLPRAKERCIELGLSKVVFPGFISGETKRHAFKDADVYFFPTNYGEGMPNSVLEAMAYGLPVVTRPVGGLRDFFEDGKMGFITESLDPVVFADLLERLLLNPELRKKIGEYNRKYAFEHFRASIVAKRLIHIYEDVLGKYRPD